MKELFIRFVVGGTVVSFFAVLGDLVTVDVAHGFHQRASLAIFLHPLERSAAFRRTSDG